MAALTDASVVAETRELLALSPANVRLISAVHEAGHVVVGHTLGMTVSRARLADDDSLHAHVTVDYGYPAGTVIPLPDLLAMRAAGFQAAFTWLDSRALLDDRRNQAINNLAGGDIKWCLATCRDLGVSDTTMQDGIVPAVHVLQRRWRTVLRLAYALAAAGSLSQGEIGPLLADDRAARLDALDAYRHWRDVETVHRWYRNPT